MLAAQLKLKRVVVEAVAQLAAQYGLELPTRLMLPLYYHGDDTFSTKKQSGVFFRVLPDVYVFPAERKVGNTYSPCSFA